MKNRKNIIVILIVILVGFGIGVFFATFTPKSTDQKAQNSAGVVPPTRVPITQAPFMERVDPKAERIGISTELDKSSIVGVRGNINIGEGAEEADRALLTVKFANTTNQDMTGIMLWARSLKGGDVRFLGGKDTHAPKKDPLRDGWTVFEYADLARGAIATANIWIYSFDQGEFPIIVKVTSTQNISAMSDGQLLTVK